MEYLALYRKYRPKDLEEVVGQNEIKKVLASSVKNGTITHAYLFSGPRGTGKTTMAKILSKMVNCEHPVDGNACNKCDSCLNVLNSSDVIEIDAASNNGVDEIRNLREKATLVPTSSKYKVYIIDEVHMLTTQAFNALLKTLEEPPKHVIFILATTEYYKIPLTISSRCQKFQFNKISIDNIVDRLKTISELEKIEIDDNALYEIAKISDGGMRDSINFLDQLRSFNNHITIDDVYDVCGNISIDEMTNLLMFLRNNEAEKITSFFEKMNNDGKNYNKFFEDFICFLKDAILYKNNVNEKYINSELDYVKKIDSFYSLEDLFNILDKVNNLVDKLKNVSRQVVVIIAHFLLIMNELNSNSNIKKEDFSNNDKYEVAFDFTKNDVNSDSKLTDENLHEKTVSSEDFNKIFNKDIIINNTFAVANKDVKNKLSKKFTAVDSYLTDNKYSVVAGCFIDTTLEVAGDGYIILSCQYDAIIEKIYNNYYLCNEFLNKIFEDKFYFVVIISDEWIKYRNEYINNIKNGNKYELLKIDNDKDFKIEKDSKEVTIVDKLFDLVGEDVVEFK